MVYPSDDADGQQLGFNRSNSAEFLLKEIDSIEESIMRCGSIASLEDINDWVQMLINSAKYNDAVWANRCMLWFYSTQGANGEGKWIAAGVAAGHIDGDMMKNGKGSGVKGWLRNRLKKPEPPMSQ